MLHKHFKVNGKCVNIPSFLVRVGDVITIDEKSQSLSKFKSLIEANSSRVVPKWLEVNNDKFEAKKLSLPAREDIDLEVEETLIVELYSK